MYSYIYFTFSIYIYCHTFKFDIVILSHMWIAVDSMLGAVRVKRQILITNNNSISGRIQKKSHIRSQSKHSFPNIHIYIVYIVFCFPKLHWVSSDWYEYIDRSFSSIYYIVVPACKDSYAKQSMLSIYIRTTVFSYYEPNPRQATVYRRKMRGQSLQVHMYFV